jgi:hypothetical protein
MSTPSQVNSKEHSTQRMLVRKHSVAGKMAITSRKPSGISGAACTDIYKMTTTYVNHIYFFHTVVDIL